METGPPRRAPPNSPYSLRLSTARTRARDGIEEAERALHRMREALEAGRANLDRAIRELHEILRRDGPPRD
jgi:hypothetical protein